MIENKEITLNQIAVMIEKVGGDVKGVAEGHQVIRSEMKQMKDEILEKISFVDGKVEHLGREFKEMKQDVSVLKQDVSGLKTKVDKIDRTLDDHVKLPAHV